MPNATPAARSSRCGLGVKGASDHLRTPPRGVDGPAPTGGPTASSDSSVSRRWFLTIHCLQRASEMALSRSQIIKVLDEPEVTYGAGGHGDRRISQRGDLAVVWDRQKRLAITVLYRRAEQWERTG